MKNIIISIIILLFVGCDEAEATSKENVTNRVMKSSIIKPVTEPVVLFLDDMTFAEAFAIEYRAKGEGHMFWWNGDQYTTNLAVLDEFVLRHVNHNETRLEWVLNNDDPDDHCRSNKLDDCGICDGLGKVTPLRTVCYGFIVALSIYILLWIVELFQIVYNWMWRI